MQRRAALGWLAACSVQARATDLLALPAFATPRAAQALMLAVAFAGPRLVAAGERGIVTLSDDLGRSWRQAAVPVSVTLTGLCFPSPNVGYATGHDGAVLATRDGGATWRLVFDGRQANRLVLAAARARLDAARAANDAAALKDAELALDDAVAADAAGPARPLLSCAFADERNGWVVGSYGQIFRTDDGGASWALPQRLPPNPDNLHYNAIVAAGGGWWIAGEGGRVYRSEDGGANWQRHDTGYKGQLYGVLDAGAPLAYGFGGHLFRRAGKDWQRVATTTKKSLVGGVRLADGRIVLASQDGGVESSVDGGRSFRYHAPSLPLPLAAIATTPDRTRAVVCGFGGCRLLPVASAA